MTVPPPPGSLFDPAPSALPPLTRLRLLLDARSRLIFPLLGARIKEADGAGPGSILWEALGPALSWCLMYLVFSSRFGDKIASYSLYLLLALVLADFFMATTTKLTLSLVRERELVLNTRVSREVIVMADAGQPLIKLSIGLTLCLVAELFLGEISLKLLVMPMLLLEFVAFTLAVSLVLAIASCFLSDVHRVYGLFSRLILMTSPVFFSLDQIGHQTAALLLALNPLALFIHLIRGTFMHSQPLHPGLLGYSVVLVIASTLLAYRIFRSLEMKAVEQL